MRKSEKAGVVEELRAAMQEHDVVILTDYRGLTVKEISELRRKLAPIGASVKVIKNTLMERALEESQAALKPYLTGPVAATFISGDFTVVLKEMSAFARTHDELKFKGGWVEAHVYNGEQVAALATIPPREQLLGMLVSAMNAPLSQLVGTLQAGPRDLMLTLMSLVEQRGGGVETAAASA